MNNKDKKELETLAKKLAHDYFINRDYTKIIKCISTSVSWFGTGVTEICKNIKDALLYLTKEEQLYGGSFTLTNEWYHANLITNDVGCVMSGMNVTTLSPEGYSLQLPLRFSVIFVRESKGWKITHLHNSVPYYQQGKDVYFNQKSAKKEYVHIKNLAKTLAADDVETAQYEDVLTGILNLEGITRKVKDLINQYPNGKLGVVKLNVNRFGYINQIYGYSMGDKVLHNIAENLSRRCSIGEICGRIENNDFALIKMFDGDLTIEKWVSQLDNISLLDDELQAQLQTKITFTLGIYLATEPSIENVKNMLYKASIAQKSVLCIGQSNTHAYFNSTIHQQQLYRTQLVQDAPEALINNEFRLYIQPKVNLDTQRIIGGEALVRWHKPDGAIIMPGDFIELFEKEGLIRKLDFYMLELLCKHLKVWLDNKMVPVPISINQSRIHVSCPNYIAEFCQIIDKYNIPHKYISFELTEGFFVEDQQSMCTLAQELRQHGFQLEIDDFGSGYASLNMISILSADILKLDRSLLIGLDTKDGHSRIVLRKIIEMAHETGMEVVCEGVETYQQLACLEEFGCDIVQGFYFYKPMPIKWFEEKLIHEKNNLNEK